MSEIEDGWKIEDGDFVLRVYGPHAQSFAQMQAARPRNLEKKHPARNNGRSYAQFHSQGSDALDEILKTPSATSSAPGDWRDEIIKEQKDDEQKYGEHGPAHVHIAWRDKSGIPHETRFMLIPPDSSIHFPFSRCSLTESEINCAQDVVNRHIDELMGMWREAHRGTDLENQFYTPAQAANLLLNQANSSRNGSRGNGTNGTNR